MQMSRRTFIHLAATLTAVPAVALTAGAPAYPTRAVRIVVGFTAGGSTDIIARVIGQWLSERLNQSFVIENRAGAGATIGTEAVVHAPPDGHTLLLVNSADTINATLYEKLNFNFLRDIAPVASIARHPQLMLANPSGPARSFPELIAYAKSNPGKLTMASPGNGTIGHLSGEMLKLMTDVNLVHVPYRGAAPAVTDLLAGHVQILFTGMTGSIEYVRAGTLRALAVTANARADALPEVPAVSEFVPGYEAVGLFGIGAPKNTPVEIVEGLNNAINAALSDPKMKARIADLGGTVLPGSPAEFGRLLVAETEKWGKVIRVANIKST